MKDKQAIAEGWQEYEIHLADQIVSKCWKRLGDSCTDGCDCRWWNREELVGAIRDLRRLTGW